MIGLQSIADKIEIGLNTNISDKNLSFKVWTDAGKYQKAQRVLNTVQYIFPALLTCVSSTNTTASSGLIMGIQSLYFELMIPQKKPRTLPTEESTEDYDFIAEIRSLLDNYFSANQITMIEDSGRTFKVGMAYGLSLSGNTDISSHFGLTVTFGVDITLLYAENGINSRDVTVQFDTLPITFETAVPSRYATVNTDVFSGKKIAKNIVTSTAFSFDFTLPCTTDGVSSQFIEYMFNGEPNVAHFVKITWGDDFSKIFLMTLKDVQSSVEGVEIAGLTMPLVEILDLPETMGYPKSFYVAILYLQNVNSPTSVTLPAGMYYFDGEAFELVEQSSVSKQIDTANLIYTQEKGYGVYLISPAQITISGLSNVKEIAVIQGGEDA